MTGEVCHIDCLIIMSPDSHDEASLILQLLLGVPVSRSVLVLYSYFLTWITRLMCIIYLHLWHQDALWEVMFYFPWGGKNNKRYFLFHTAKILRMWVMKDLGGKKDSSVICDHFYVGLKKNPSLVIPECQISVPFELTSAIKTYTTEPK